MLRGTVLDETLNENCGNSYTLMETLLRMNQCHNHPQAERLFLHGNDGKERGDAWRWEKDLRREPYSGYFSTLSAGPVLSSSEKDAYVSSFRDGNDFDADSSHN